MGDGEHQNKLRPSDNKFHRGNGDDGKHYWLTPPDLYARLDAEFRFTFDPCPHPLPVGFDGLTCEWGARNYVNPPFGSIIHQGRKKGPTAWMKKAIEESRKGKLVVIVYPIDKWVLMMLEAVGSTVRNLGDVRWHSIEDGMPGKGTGRHIAMFTLDLTQSGSTGEGDDMRKTVGGHRAHIFEHLEGAAGGPYSNRSLYAVDGLPGIWRRVGGPRVSDPLARGILPAFCDGGMIYLQYAEKENAELVEGGLTDDYHNDTHIAWRGDIAEFVDSLRAAAKTTEANLLTPEPSQNGTPPAPLPTPDPAAAAPAPAAAPEADGGAEF